MQLDKKTIRTLLLMASFCIVLYWGLQNLDRVGVILNRVWGLMSPFVVGGSLAFILNVPMRAIEKKLPQKLVRKIEEMQLKTADFDAICVNLCINYGGRREIAHAAQRAAQSGEVSEQSIAANLYNNLPFPDVIVRTGERFFAHVCRLF